MFRRMAGDRAEMLFRLHPVQLSALLELAWELRVDDKIALGQPDRRSDLLELPRNLLDQLGSQTPHENFIQMNRSIFRDTSPRLIRWDHLIYAYMVENTRIYEMFRRVLHEFLHGDL